MSMITRRVGRYKVLLPINLNHYHFREKENSQVMKERKNLHQKTDVVRLVDLNYNFECNWLI